MNASTSVYFNVKAHEVPFVKIVKVFYDDAKIKFIAVVRSPLPNLKIEWSCKQVDEEGNEICLLYAKFLLCLRLRTPLRKFNNHHQA